MVHLEYIGFYFTGAVFLLACVTTVARAPKKSSLVYKVKSVRLHMLTYYFICYKPLSTASGVFLFFVLHLAVLPFFLRHTGFNPFAPFYAGELELQYLFEGTKYPYEYSRCGQTLSWALFHVTYVFFKNIPWMGNMFSCILYCLQWKKSVNSNTPKQIREWVKAPLTFGLVSFLFSWMHLLYVLESIFSLFVVWLLFDSLTFDEIVNQAGWYCPMHKLAKKYMEYADKLGTFFGV